MHIHISGKFTNNCLLTVVRFYAQTILMSNVCLNVNNVHIFQNMLDCFVVYTKNCVKNTAYLNRNEIKFHVKCRKCISFIPYSEFSLTKCPTYFFQLACVYCKYKHPNTYRAIYFVLQVHGL